MMDILKSFRIVSLAGVMMGFAGCASQPPKPITVPVEPSLEISTVLESPAQYTGRQVRWGGTIANIENTAETTRIEIVSRQLERKGRPKSNDNTSGRFIAIVDTFLDPGVYTKDRQITVRGRLAGSETGKIGDYDYTYPLVTADIYQLWKPLAKSSAYYDPFWDYDPWFYRPYYYRPHFYPFHPYY